MVTALLAVMVAVMVAARVVLVVMVVLAVQDNVKMVVKVSVKTNAQAVQVVPVVLVAAQLLVRVAQGVPTLVVIAVIMLVLRHAPMLAVVVQPHVFRPVQAVQVVLMIVTAVVQHTANQIVKPLVLLLAHKDVIQVVIHNVMEVVLHLHTRTLNEVSIYDI